MNQFNKPLHNVEVVLGIDPSFEPVGRFRVYTKILPGLSYPYMVEMCNLEQDIFRILFYTRIFSSHDSSNSYYAFSVRYESFPSLQRVFFLIQKDNLFTWPCLSHNYRTFFQQVQIERVNRMSRLEHHVVCGVNHRVYGSHTTCNEPNLHPEGTVFNFYTPHNLCGVPGAPFSILYHHFHNIGGLFLSLRQSGFWPFVWNTAERGKLSCYSYDGETIWSVRGNLYIENRFIHLEEAHNIRSQWNVFFEPVNSLGLFLKPQFLQRAHHSFGEDSLYLQRFYNKTCMKLCSFECEGNDISHFYRWISCNDCIDFISCVHSADEQSIRIRMLFNTLNPSDDDLTFEIEGFVHILDVVPTHCELTCYLFNIPIDIYVFSEPGKRYLHPLFPPINICSRS